MSAKKRTTKIRLYSGAEVTVYAGAKVQAALKDVTDDLTLYKGVRLAQLLEAIYVQGKKDGARDAFEEISRGIGEAQARVPHRPPGRPKKRVR
jgi:hypothetical protein